MLNLYNYWGINFSLLLALGLSPHLSQLPSIVVPEVQNQAPAPEAVNLPADFANPSYVLGPGDQININVYEYEEFTGTKVILPDGTINLPLIGTVKAANLTTEELAVELTARLQNWVVNPIVNVSINKLRPLLINVAGEVQRPGPIQLSSYNISDFGGASSLPTLSSALIQAGGVTKNADIRRIVLRRLTRNGNFIELNINLWDSLFSEKIIRELVLQDGDSIFVPKLAAGETLDRRALARSSIASKTVRVRVVGEVKKPGEFEVPPSSSISSAIASAGGPTDKAKLSEVTFVRMLDDGTINRQELDLSNLTDTLQVQEGDVIIVPKSRTSTFLDVSNQSVGPLSLLLQLFTFFVNLSR
ncbi:MAG: polysaccharide biosynthesis/export family protein [Oscillatoriaceae bacterium SKW80]|nr:polysaccharide biosynthesis/export family protein [Oscillatoriaceae bacterium SKYG93]MCX8120687.1 polysaccharide biosynthesis/export family protein [Oscillatoriaceae bacterium SKW80]MDW8453775.1 polysaccharide biosynthesis/export family protein [Oscillatoriaceae cyanobacterium SKYGB_i_bin93]HIK27005.1 polysaccharide biosynthesis/export family protein [Oscillatoriaceae cyanobacterium M7585_C2015_266]